MESPAADGAASDDTPVAFVGRYQTDGVDWQTIARRERKRQQRQTLLQSMTRDERAQFFADETAEKSHRSERLQRAHDEGQGLVKLAVDLQYDHIMNEKELHSLAKQLKFVYGSIKMMREPFQLRLFHCSEQLKTSLARFSADRWLVHWHATEDLTDVVPAEDIVYLSPDSPNVLTLLEADKMYVIGGIVDKSRKKGATLATAERAGIPTARLPIQEHITERLDHILNVNTVVDVLIHFHTHGDWRRALTEVLPVRKQNSVGRRSIKRQQQQRAADQAVQQDDTSLEDAVESTQDDAATAFSALSVHGDV